MSENEAKKQSDQETPEDKPQETAEAPERRADTPVDEIAERGDEPREGESPEQPPREEPPEAEEIDVAPAEKWRPVPNQFGHGGVPWEELRKGATPVKGQSVEQRLWDDRGVSKPQQIDYPKKTWDELPEETTPPEEKISSP